MGRAKAGGDDTRERLIVEGVRELDAHGITEFSTRRVAKNCGVSSAAPYKHFENTHAFITEILKYINESYHTRQKQVLERYRDCDSRRQLLEVALDYVRFLAEHPEFFRVILQNFRTESDYQVLRGKLSLTIYKVVARYCRDVNMTPEARQRKTFVVRSIIYGAALFFCNGDMRYDEGNMETVKSMLEREFDLP